MLLLRRFCLLVNFLVWNRWLNIFSDLGSDDEVGNDGKNGSIFLVIFSRDLDVGFLLILFRSFCSRSFSWCLRMALGALLGFGTKGFGSGFAVDDAVVLVVDDEAKTGSDTFVGVSNRLGAKGL